MKLNKLSCFFLGLALLMQACDASTDNATNTSIPQTESQQTDVDITPDADLRTYFDEQISGKYVIVQGEVIKNLADDNDGSRHQKFLLELESGQTLMIVHNIDLADRISDLQVGDDVTVAGEYEWNNRGGLIHWTHHDPQGKHRPGYINHKEFVYQ